jgi:hypothetical protein
MLASWNEGPAKSAIFDFVARVTKEGGGTTRSVRRAHRDLKTIHSLGRSAD